MADKTTPLIIPSQTETTNKPELVLSSIDETIESCIGSTGFCQLFQAILISCAWVFDAQQTFISVFTDADPQWHCTSSSSSCSSAVSPCGLADGSWSWNQPSHTSIVSEWGLQCSSSAIVGMPASLYFLGCLVGGLLFATLADSWLGRKNMLSLSCFTMSVAAASAAFSPNLWVYSALRFICGMGRATIGTSALILATESVGKRWRERISIVSFFCFTLGFLSLPGMAYLGRGSSWRNLYLWTSLPSLCYAICVHLLTRESPRWLLVRGRRVEAIDTLKSIAKSNGYTIVSSFSNLSIAEEKLMNDDIFSALKILWDKRWAFRRLTSVMIIGFGIGMLYYGMPLNVGNLGSNIYMSVTFNALAEFPSSLLTLFLICRINRRCSVLFLTAISGITSILCVFLRSTGWKIGVEVVSFFSACTAFNVVFIYCIELFPTCVRNSAMSMVRQSVVFGGVFAPFLVAEGRKKELLSFGVFGLVIGCCGLFAACLPETRGRGISDTLEEEEYKEVVSNMDP